MDGIVKKCVITAQILDSKSEANKIKRSLKKKMRVVDKTRDSTTSKICPFLLTLIAHVESGQILLFVESHVLSTTIFTTINTYYAHNCVQKCT